jgi:hypothetical protein
MTRGSELYNRFIRHKERIETFGLKVTIAIVGSLMLAGLFCWLTFAVIMGSRFMILREPLQ